jgi:hypothetical protein
MTIIYMSLDIDVIINTQLPYHTYACKCRTYELNVIKLLEQDKVPIDKLYKYLSIYVTCSYSYVNHPIPIKLITKVVDLGMQLNKSTINYIIKNYHDIAETYIDKVGVSFKDLIDFSYFSLVNLNTRTLIYKIIKMSKLDDMDFEKVCKYYVKKQDYYPLMTDLLNSEINISKNTYCYLFQTHDYKEIDKIYEMFKKIMHCSIQFINITVLEYPKIAIKMLTDFNIKPDQSFMIHILNYDLKQFEKVADKNPDINYSFVYQSHLIKTRDVNRFNSILNRLQPNQLNSFYNYIFLLHIGDMLKHSVKCFMNEGLIFSDVDINVIIEKIDQETFDLLVNFDINFNTHIGNMCFNNKIDLERSIRDIINKGYQLNYNAINALCSHKIKVDNVYDYVTKDELENLCIDNNFYGYDIDINKTRRVLYNHFKKSSYPTCQKYVDNHCDELDTKCYEMACLDDSYKRSVLKIELLIRHEIKPNKEGFKKYMKNKCSDRTASSLFKLTMMD